MTNFRTQAAKFGAYLLLAYLFTIVQTTPRLLTIGGVRPMLTAALAVAVAICEGELAGGFFGAAAGLLTDFFSYNKMGYNSLLFFLCCVAIGLAVGSYMRPVTANCVLFTVLTLLLTESVSFFFRFFLRGVEEPLRLYSTAILPMIAVTALTAIPIHLLVRWLHGWFEKRIQR